VRNFTTLAVMLLSAVAALAPAGAATVDALSGDVIRLEGREWRIANIDAPEIDSPCPDVRRVGLLARAKLAEIVTQGEPQIQATGERDRNRRATAYVRINGEDVGEKMIAARLVQRHSEARQLCPVRRRSDWYPRNPPGPSSGQLQGIHR